MVNPSTLLCLFMALGILVIGGILTYFLGRGKGFEDLGTLHKRCLMCTAIVYSGVEVCPFCGNRD